MILKFNKSIYPKHILIKSAYSFTDRAYLHLDEDEDFYIVNIEFKENNVFDINEFKNEMLCQTARYEVYKKTKELRKLTVARALASTVINESEQNYSDETDSENTNIDIDSILEDWFDNNE